MKSPCMNCINRKTACHDTCDAYKSWAIKNYKSKRLPDEDAIYFGYAKESGTRFIKYGRNNTKSVANFSCR